jgi:hypothetical protein
MKDCIIWHGKYRDKDGYGRSGSMSAHRKVYQDAFGPIPKGMVVRHKCDNRECVNLEHLELGTHKQNMEDRAKRNRWHGEQVPKAKLTEQQVREIKALKGKMSSYAVSEKYPVGPYAIQSIWRGQSWVRVV